MDLTNYEQALRQRSANQKKGINSHIHEVTLEVSEYVGEPKQFALWLGITKRVGAGEMIGLLKQMKERGIRSPKYLMVCVRNLHTKMITTKASLKCGHYGATGAGAVLDGFQVFPCDHRVTGLRRDLKFTPLDRCEKLTVVQEYRAINRYFIVKDPSIIQKP